MSFPLGKSILALCAIAILSGGAVIFHRLSPPADLTLWTFADVHARMYTGTYAAHSASDGPSLLQQFENQTGHSVRLDLIALQALDIRLISLFMSGNTDAGGPDLVELEIGSIGKFFRAPTDEVGLLPLNSFLEKSGWMNRIVHARFAPWSKGPIIFGIPHDLHPCTITYREDLFDEAGVDLESAKTWPDFQSRALQFQSYWHAHGHDRIALQLSTTAVDAVTIFLQQRHVNLVDPDLTIHLDDPKVLSTMLWYVQAVAGPNRIGGDFNPAPGQDVRDLANGDLCGMITPDWQIGNIRNYAPDMMGKLHMRPLPRFSPDDAPTASWGGTMISITRSCKNPGLAWKLIETLYLDRAALKVRQQSTSILPPIPEYWSDPIYQQPDPNFGGQKTDQLFLSLARDLPPRFATAYTAAAQTMLSVVLSRMVSMEKDRSDPATLETNSRRWLADGAQNLRDTINFDQAAN